MPTYFSPSTQFWEGLLSRLTTLRSLSMAAPKTEVGVEASKVKNTESVLMSFMTEKVEMFDEKEQRWRRGEVDEFRVGLGTTGRLLY